MRDLPRLSCGRIEERCTRTASGHDALRYKRTRGQNCGGPKFKERRGTTLRNRHRQIWLLLVCLALLSCGGGGGGSDAPACTSNCTPPAVATDFLTVADVEKIIAQGAHEANARKAPATIAVSDRVGNILAVFQMTGARDKFRITSEREGRAGARGGLENIDILPAAFAAISKAVTGAYLSSNGNAFSSRTASQIVQENFNPRENNQPSGPLFGVQFSQLACSDLIAASGFNTTSIGPKPSPLGLSADPGGDRKSVV